MNNAYIISRLVQERDAAEARVAQLTGYITGFVQLLDRQQAVVKRYEAALRDERLREALVVCLNRLREYGAPEHDVGVVAALDALEDPRPFAKCQGGED